MVSLVSLESRESGTGAGAPGVCQPGENIILKPQSRTRDCAGSGSALTRRHWTWEPAGLGLDLEELARNPTTNSLTVMVEHSGRRRCWDATLTSTTMRYTTLSMVR